MSRWRTSNEAPAARDDREATRAPGLLVVLSGPAGVGKTAVGARVCERLGLRRSVSATTRAPREGEVEGRDYLFVSEEAFEARIARGEFLEHARVHEHLYGTPRGPVERATAAGESRLLVIDVQGAMQVKERRPGSLFIFLDAPDASLRARLAARGSEGEAEVDARLRTAGIEREYKEHYDHCVLNDDLDHAVAEVCDIIATARRLKDRRHPLDG